MHVSSSFPSRTLEWGQRQGDIFGREKGKEGERERRETGSIVEDREGEGEGGHAKNRGAAHAMVCYIDRSGTELS